MLSLFKTFDSALMFENVCKIHVQCNKNCSAPYIGVKEAYRIKDTCKLKKNSNSYLLNGHSYDF